MSNPLVTIIIPVYNAENYLPHCINSVLKQTYHNFELIIVDDGSADSSPDLCDDFSKNDNRITVIHTENGGVSRARNIGISYIKGEYVMFVDSDDALPVNAVELYVNNMIQNNVDIIQGKIGTFNIGQEPVLSREKDDYPLEIVTIEEFIKTSTNRTQVWGKIYKASIIKKYRFPEGHHSEDMYYNALYFTDDEINTAGILSAETYLRYDCPTSITHSFTIEDYFDNIIVLDELYTIIKNKTNNQTIQNQYLQLLFSQLCVNRYNIVIRKKYQNNIKREIQKIRNNHLKELWDSELDFKHKLALFIFSRWNYIYRLWLLHIDPTMKDFEKNIVTEMNFRQYHEKPQ